MQNQQKVRRAPGGGGEGMVKLRGGVRLTVCRGGGRGRILNRDRGVREKEVNQEEQEEEWRTVEEKQVEDL